MPYKTREARRAHDQETRPRRRQYRLDNKLKVLAHYGKDKKLKCCWSGCDVNDPDLLTLDHVADDGNVDSRRKDLYDSVLAQGLPDGKFQTLCWNHQWKKELMRRRANIN